MGREQRCGGGGGQWLLASMVGCRGDSLRDHKGGGTFKGIKSDVSDLWGNEQSRY